MEPGLGKPVVVSGAPPRTSPWIEVVQDERLVRKFVVFPDADELDGMNLSTHTDPPFNHMRAIAEARRHAIVTHCFQTGYYVTSPTTGKPVWSNHVACSHQKCGYFDTDTSYEALHERWEERADCTIDVNCPISATVRRERARRRGRDRA